MMCCLHINLARARGRFSGKHADVFPALSSFLRGDKKGFCSQGRYLDILNFFLVSYLPVQCSIDLRW